MFIELTPKQTISNQKIEAVTINFHDVRSFYFDQNVSCTILRFFDETRTNFQVEESIEIIQEALDEISVFCSAKKISAGLNPRRMPNAS